MKRKADKKDYDLFGRAKKRRPQYWSVLKRFDEATFKDRLKRLQWLISIFPKYDFIMLDLELHYILIEAKMSFINGNFVSTLLLCNAFLEQWLAAILISSGFEREAKGGMKSILNCLQKNNLLNEFLVKNIDKIREIRNPFAHLKPFEHKARLSQRVLEALNDPVNILEKDAKDALSLMYQITITHINRYGPNDSAFAV